MNTLRIRTVAGPANLYPGFIHIATRSIVPNGPAPCDIYMEGYNPHVKRLRLVPVLAAGDLVEAAWLEHLAQGGLTICYVRLENLEELLAYLLARTQDQKAGIADITPEQRHHLFYEASLCIIKAAMLDLKNGRRLAQGVGQVRELLAWMWNEEQTHSGLLDVMIQDRQIYTHSVNTCLLGLGFAHTLGWEPERSQDLGLALFFHDLGLMWPDGGTPEHAARLLAEENTLVDHPRHGGRLLQTIPGVSQAVVEMIRNHHENLDGTGFPHGLKGPQLSAADRLIRIVDLYESYTAGFYCEGELSPFVTLKLMRQDLAGKLDRDLLESFIVFLGHM
ncbi:MAG: HD domain-containing protein [Deltaproteobacteria bacterium]|nr:HD domain-containing protein [Deltaproteobacteria bacterium]